MGWWVCPSLGCSVVVERRHKSSAAQGWMDGVLGDLLAVFLIQVVSFPFIHSVAHLEPYSTEYTPNNFLVLALPRHTTLPHTVTNPSIHPKEKVDNQEKNAARHQCSRPPPPHYLRSRSNRTSFLPNRASAHPPKHLPPPPRPHHQLHRYPQRHRC